MIAREPRGCRASSACDAAPRIGTAMVQRAARRNDAPRLAPPIVRDVMQESGTPLDTSTRSFMESRFDRDFSGVRVHTGPRAEASARAVDALAYTVGSHVAFDSGQFDPGGAAGQRLLAHELAHVVQQEGATPATTLAVAPNDSAHESAARAASEHAGIGRASTGMSMAQAVQRAPRGRSTMDDSEVQIAAPDPKAPGVVSGTVTRREKNPEGKEIGSGDARVRFDPASCRVTVPVRVAYRAPTTSDTDQFARTNGGRKPKPVVEAVGRATFDEYIRVTNERLNGWFAVQFGECKGSPCSGHIVPIVVDVVEDNAKPDYTVAVVDGGDQGRSSVSSGAGAVVLAGAGGSVRAGVLAHEAGHMALAAPDEYHEELIKGKDSSRERPDDFSLMASEDSFRGWSLLHERHFHFVATFLDAAMKKAGTPCSVSLVGLARPTKFDMRANITLGVGSLNGSPAYAPSASVGIGALSGDRNWRTFVDLHATALLALDTSRRTAFMLGGRVGLERRYTPSSGGVSLSGFVGAGAGSFTMPDPADSKKTSTRWLAYGEAGGQVGYGFEPGSGVLFKLFVEAAAGTTLNVRDPSHQYWFRAGLGAAAEF